MGGGGREGRVDAVTRKQNSTWERGVGEGW